MILIDTNVLVYAINTSSSQHEASRRLLEMIQAGLIRGGLVPQVLLEFFAVITDPRRVENPLDPHVALQQIESLKTRLPVYDDALRALTLCHN